MLRSLCETRDCNSPRRARQTMALGSTSQRNRTNGRASSSANLQRHGDKRKLVDTFRGQLLQIETLDDMNAPLHHQMYVDGHSVRRHEPETNGVLPSAQNPTRP